MGPTRQNYYEEHENKSPHRKSCVQEGDAYVQEEAWDLTSSVFSSAHEYGGTTSTDHDLFFTKHSTRCFPLILPEEEGADANNEASGCFMDIASIDQSKLTLLDVCNFQTEDVNVDGSGHCIWMGALFFIHALTLTLDHNNHDLGDDNNDGLQCLMSEYFDQRIVAELGCGTGASGIALLKVIQHTHSERHAIDKPASTTTTKVWFLDNDPEAIELCRANCQRNGLLDPDQYQVLQHSSWTSTDEDSFPNDIETILATDVLYDLPIIRPFFETSARLLTTKSANKEHSSGHLVLSHVPRWFLPSPDKHLDDHEEDAANEIRQQAVRRVVPEKIDNEDEMMLQFRGQEEELVTTLHTMHSTTNDPTRELEQHIINQAAQCGLELIHTVRPAGLSRQLRVMQQRSIHTSVAAHFQQRESELQEMEQAGAVVLVFRIREPV